MSKTNRGDPNAVVGYTGGQAILTGMAPGAVEPSKSGVLVQPSSTPSDYRTPQAREPLVDIVILVHSQWAWADLAIRAVEHNTVNPYRLIIVDSASTEPRMAQVLDGARQRGHTVIRLAENRSFSNGVNAGVAAGSSKYIILLNDDAIVTPQWDAALLQDVSDKTVGMAGARSNYAGGAQGDPSWDRKTEPPVLVFVCVAMRRDVWNTVGQLDGETFDGFAYEDIDYSIRVKKAGYRLRVSGAYVLHAGSQSLMAKLGSVDEYSRNDQKYRARLTDKWGKEFVDATTSFRKSILVASYHAEEHTRVRFMQDFMNLKKAGNHPFSYFNCIRMPIHTARTAVADYALDHGFEWLVQLDDDATFPPDLVARLMSHGKDVVTALAYQRKPPHWPCIYEYGDDGMMGKPLEGVEHTGLRRVDVSGFHCSLIRTSVFKKLREGVRRAPTAEHPDGEVIIKGTRQYYGGFDNKLGEDFALCVNLKRIGVQIYCDTDLISGHIGDAIVIDEAYAKEFKRRTQNG